MFRPELVLTERHPNVSGEGVRACDTFYQIVRQAVGAGLPALSLDALFLLCWSVVHGLACLVLDGPLDVVMPHLDRKAQLAEVIAQFDRLMAASAAQVPTRTPRRAAPESRKAAARAKKPKQSAK
jgi:hypothetical protein